MVKRIKLNKVVVRVGINDEAIRRLQFNGSPEIGDANGDGIAIVYIAWVSKQSDSCVSLVLDHIYQRRRFHFLFRSYINGGSDECFIFVSDLQLK